jgi:hypothetical protein
VKRSPAQRKASLGETLETLRAFGLLDRTLKLKVGETEVLMDVKPPEPEEDEKDSPKLRNEREELELADKMYGAASGKFPGMQ